MHPATKKSGDRGGDLAGASGRTYLGGIFGVATPSFLSQLHKPYHLELDL